MEVTRLTYMLLACKLAYTLPTESLAIISSGLAKNIVGKISDVQIQGKTYNIQSFLGIPYAKPPVGKLRFKKPKPAEYVIETYNATVFRPSCPRLDTIHPRFPTVLSENCLYLNIFVPNKITENGQRFAVMVYIQDDTLPFDNSDTFVPDVMASFGDVIIVTLNYRTGMLGFLNLGVKDGAGNLGLWDQRLALQWINRHIESFGGDRNRVSLLGHSYGATYSIFHALHTGNKGLFQRIISQSGVHLLNSNFKKDPALQLSNVLNAFHCEDGNKKALIKCLQSIDLDLLASKFHDFKTTGESRNGFNFLPNIDHDFFGISPLELTSFRESQNDHLYFFKSLGMLIGFNSHDGLHFGDILADNLQNFNPSVANFKTQCVQSTIDTLNLEKTPLVLDLIEAEYMDNLATNGSGNVRDICVDLITDTMFAVGSLGLANANSVDKHPSNKTYVYRFSANPTSHIFSTPCWIHGAGHGDELQFVFGIPDETTRCRHSFFEKKPENWELQLSYKMMTYWTNFAKSGNPNVPVSVLPQWPSHDLQSPGYLDISEDLSKSSVKYHLQDRQLRFWKTVFPFVRDASLYNLTESCLVTDVDQHEDYAFMCGVK